MKNVLVSLIFLVFSPILVPCLVIFLLAWLLVWVIITAELIFATLFFTLMWALDTASNMTDMELVEYVKFYLDVRYCP